MKSLLNVKTKYLMNGLFVCLIIWAIISIIIIGLAIPYELCYSIIVSIFCTTVFILLAKLYDDLYEKYLEEIKELHKNQLIKYLESGKLLDEIKQTDDSHVIDYWHKQLIEENNE